MFDDAKESQQAKDALQLDLLGGPTSDRAVG
jgi:hypothetical protein